MIDALHQPLEAAVRSAPPGPLRYGLSEGTFHASQPLCNARRETGIFLLYPGGTGRRLEGRSFVAPLPLSYERRSVVTACVSW